MHDILHLFISRLHSGAPTELSRGIYSRLHLGVTQLQLCHITDPDMVNAGLALQLRGERLRGQVILLQQQCNIIPNFSTYNGYAGLQIGHRTHSRGRGYREDWVVS